MFARASAGYPASVTGQAAMIARICKEQGLNPGQLASALIQNDGVLITLVRLANQTHEHKGHIAEDIDKERIKGIVRQDFTLARTLIALPISTLRRIEGEYERFFCPTRDENSYRSFASDLFTKHTKNTSAEFFFSS